MPTNQKIKNVIIGAGPTGLAAGYELTKNNQEALILERENQTGGLCRTVDYKGYKFDIGGHRFFTKNKEVMDLWQTTLGDDLLTRPRLSRMYYKKKFFAYPIKPLDVLHKMGVLESIKAITSFFIGKIRYYPQRHKLEKYKDWVIYNFGEHLYRAFFESYNEKGWGLNAEEMSSKWYQQRVKGISILSLVKTALLPFTQKKIRSLINEFYYPRFGPGMMYGKLADNIKDAKGEIFSNSSASKIIHKDFTVKEVIYQTPKGEERISVENCISSLPLTKLLEKFEPQPPQEIIDAINHLKYRSFLTVCLIIDNPQSFPDNWIYVHEPGVRVARVQNFKNWSPEMVPDSNKTSLGFEFFCWQEDDLWDMGHDKLIELAAEELETIKLGKTSEVIGGTVIKAPDSYPIYMLGYEQNLQIVENYLKRFKNLYSIGRAGMYRWNNMDHSILTGLYTARNIMGENYDISAINAEAEYHEEEGIDKQ